MAKLIDICLKFISVPAIFFIITIHSFTKAAVSTALGDNLPKNNGRLSLNPFKHIDGIGLLLFFFMSYGWDKPIRTSSFCYKNKKRDTILVNASPILACLLVSYIAIFINSHFIRLGYIGNPNLYKFLYTFIEYVSIYGITMAVFNIIPIYPMDASAILKAFLTPNQIIGFNRSEGILQLLLVFALMLGFLNSILYPIVNIIYSFFAMIQ